MSGTGCAVSGKDAGKAPREPDALERICIGDHYAHGHAAFEMVDERIVEAAAEGHVGAFVLSGETELVERLQAYVHVAVLQQFVVEVFLGEIGVQRKQGAVFAGGVGERNLACGVLFTVFRNLSAGRLVVGLGGAGEPQHILHVGPVHIGLGEVGI